MKPSAVEVLPRRVLAFDAYRGLVMFLMMAEVLKLDRVAQHFHGNALWDALAFHSEHVAWTGCSLHDLIQPSFSFLVGVALPYSVASRQARGQSFALMLGHALWRSLLLIALGIFLRSVHRSQTNFTFEDTLTQIGLGYTFLFLLAFCGVRLQTVALVVVLFGYWAAFALYPLPGPDFPYARVGVPVEWTHHFTGFASHWNKNSNAAWAFDTWFLNLFSREKTFAFNGGGYATLSFIPTLGTMILGLIAGEWLKGAAPTARKLLWLVLAGVACLAAGWLLDWSGICPNVKRIWTPSWTLYSGGWCFLFLAGFYAVLELWNVRGWAFPLVVIGMNSIAIYCLVHLAEGFLIQSLKTHIGEKAFQVLGDVYEPLLLGSAVLLVYWLVLWWMYRRRLFLKI